MLGEGEFLLFFSCLLIETTGLILINFSTEIDETLETVIGYKRGREHRTEHTNNVDRPISEVFTDQILYRLW